MSSRTFPWIYIFAESLALQRIRFILSTSANMWKITLRILCSVHYSISDNKMNKRHSINEEQSMLLPNMRPCFLGWRRKHFICVSFVVFNTIYNFTLISPSNFYLALTYNFLSPTFVSTCSASCNQHGFGKLAFR